MSGPVIALLAVMASVYATRKTTKTNKELETLKASLARESAEQQSQRAYRDEARRKIYTDAEPLVLKLAESCDYAVLRIIQLSEPRRWPELRATRDTNCYWMLNRSSETIAMAHALLEPLGVFTLLKETVNLIDLSFDQRLHEIYLLARAAYQVHMNDYAIAKLTPTLSYDPVVPGWREKRLADPATYWWQGLTRGRLDPAVELCIHRDAGRVTTIGEFEHRYVELFDQPGDSRAKSLGLFCNPLYNFTPVDRPVYWRMLMCQLLIYRRISQRSRLSGEVETSPHFDLDVRDVDLLRRQGNLDDEFFDSNIKAALEYANSIL